MLEALTGIRRAGPTSSSPTTRRPPPDGCSRPKQSLGPSARPQARRRDPLDDLDKRVLNLMQGSTPITPRPYAAWRPRPGSRRPSARARPGAARRADDPPGHPDLRHPRARVLLDARRRQGRPREPVASGTIINAHPGVSHNYLRNHEFNIWFTIATSRIEARARGHPRGARRIAGAE